MADRTSRPRRRAAFTLVEVLASLLMMAIIIPVAIEGMSVASRVGMLGQRKAAAMRVAERVINEVLVVAFGLSVEADILVVDTRRTVVVVGRIVVVVTRRIVVVVRGTLDVVVAEGIVVEVVVVDLIVVVVVVVPVGAPPEFDAGAGTLFVTEVAKSDAASFPAESCTALASLPPVGSE